MPSGFVSVFSITGGIAPISTLWRRACAVAADVAGDLAAAGGVADVDGVLQVELFDELGEIVGIGVQVVAVPGLAGAAVTAAVVGDATVAARARKNI